MARQFIHVGTWGNVHGNVSKSRKGVPRLSSSSRELNGFTPMLTLTVSPRTSADGYMWWSAAVTSFAVTHGTTQVPGPRCAAPRGRERAGSNRNDVVVLRLPSLTRSSLTGYPTVTVTGVRYRVSALGLSRDATVVKQPRIRFRAARGEQSNGPGDWT